MNEDANQLAGCAVSAAAMAWRIPKPQDVGILFPNPEEDLVYLDEILLADRGV